MHESQEELLQPITEEKQSIDLQAAYKVFIRAFYRLECTENGSKEADHE